MIVVLKITFLAALFVASSGSLFSARFRKHRVLTGAAALVAAASTYYLLLTIHQDFFDRETQRINKELTELESKLNRRLAEERGVFDGQIDESNADQKSGGSAIRSVSPPESESKETSKAIGSRNRIPAKAAKEDGSWWEGIKRRTSFVHMSSQQIVDALESSPNLVVLRTIQGKEIRAQNCYSAGPKTQITQCFFLLRSSGEALSVWRKYKAMFLLVDPSTYKLLFGRIIEVPLYEGASKMGQ